MLARVVRFSDIQYDRNGIFLEFLYDELRPIVLLDEFAVDIFNHRIYDIIYMEDGIIPMEDLSALDHESLYAYTIYNAEFPEENVKSLKEKMEETIEWYHRECSNSASSSDRSVISFEFEKKKLKEKSRKPRKPRKS